MTTQIFFINLTDCDHAKKRGRNDNTNFFSSIRQIATHAKKRGRNDNIRNYKFYLPLTLKKCQT